MSCEIEIIKRGRGNVLLYSGYQYYRHSIYRNGTSIWRCQFYKKNKCAGSVTISTDQTTVLLKKDHHINCLSDETQNLIDKKISQTCEEAAKGLECAPSVYKRSMISIRNEGLDLVSKKPIPSFQQKKASIYRKRNRELEVNKICGKSLEEIEVPALFRKFMLADYFDGDLKILIFCSIEAKSLMTTTKQFFMDGTFKCCPFPFAQVYSIHGDIGSSSSNTNILPLVYAFMSHKSTKAYSILFKLIKAQIPEWKPSKVNVDFEEAAITAVHQYDKKIIINGCHFHFTNCLWRKAKALKINKCKRSKRIVSLCCSLAHLPLDKINDGWDYIKRQSLQNNDGMKKIIEYFEKFWMKPDFMKLWCVFSERHRTTNAVEGWHHNINKKVPKNETNLLMALNMFFNESNLTAFYGNQPPKKRRKVSIENDDFIRETQMELISGDISIAHFLDKLR